MRGSCSESALEGDLSSGVESLSQIERAHAGRARVREVGEALVAAEPLLARRALVRLLDAEGAARQRLAGQFQRPVALRALRLVEELGVDLGREDLLRAAHVPDAVERVVVEVQARALRRHARGGGDHPIAVRQALAAFGGLGAAGGPAHLRDCTPIRLVRSLPMHRVLVELSGYVRRMASRRTAVLAAVLSLFVAVPAVAAEPVQPRAGVLLSGRIDFPREQRMSMMTAAKDGSKLTVNMGFDGKCQGGGLGELWAGNVRATPAVRARDGRISASLSGSVKNVGGVADRTGFFQWRLTGAFVKRDVVEATVTGTAEVRVDGKTVSECKIARPADVRLAIRSM